MSGQPAGSGPRPGELSSGEERDWYRILEAAYRMGWLAPEDEARVIRASELITVEVSCARQQTRMRSYPDDDRWLYAFLRELSAGVWRIKQPYPLDALP